MGRLIEGPGQVIPGPIFDAHVEARAIRATARDLLAAAEAAAAELRADARRDGFALGLIEGRVQAAAQAGALLADARARAARALTAAAPAAAVLAVKMAERIVGRAVSLAPETMAEIAATAITASRPREAALTLRLHPDDLPAVSARRDLLAARAPAATEIALVADASVGRHGCVVETALGHVDARLEVQLAALERAILGAESSA
jgi:flagellar biosynthesis/type III secretory pathway protein FliH